MKRFLAACFLLSIIPASASAEFTAEQLLAAAGVKAGTEYQEVNDAFARFDKQDLTACQALLIAAKQKHPELPPGRVMFAQLLLSRNQVALARREIELEAATDPTDPEAYIILAELAVQDTRFTEASLALEQARKLADGNIVTAAGRKAKLLSRIYASLASVNEARQNWPVAQAYLSEWLKLDPQNAAGHERLGRVLFKAGKQESAYNEFELAAKSPLNTVPALSELLMGQLYEQAGNRSNATKWMNAATRMSGDNFATQMAVARWALQTNQLPEAATHAQAALALDKSSLDAMLLCGTIALLQNDRAAAEKQLEAAELQSPLNFDAGNLLALALCEEADAKKQQRALDLARANVQRFPRAAEAYATLGWVYERLGHPVEAEQALSRAVSTGPLNANGIFYIANMLERKGNNAESARLLARALESRSPFLYKEQAEKLAARLQIAARLAADQAAATKSVVADPTAVKPDVSKPDVTSPDVAKPDVTKPDVTKPDLSNIAPAKTDDKPADPKKVDPFDDLPPAKAPSK
jgi:tetratricopeptide (TPR) repeat protein